MGLPKTTQDRINADAKAVADAIKIRCDGDVVYKVGYEEGYIAGGTAENERAQKMVEALGKILIQHTYYDVIELAANALQQYNAATPDRPCPHCGKELNCDRNLCCRECGKEVAEPKQPEPKQDLGICKECKTRPATTDYNGHQYYVCKLCDDSLNREFDEEYK